MSVFISDPYAIVQTAGETYIGNETDQVYSINPNLIQAGDVVTIVDQGGTNAIELTAGLEITESIVSSNEMVLTLSNQQFSVKVYNSPKKCQSKKVQLSAR